MPGMAFIPSTHVQIGAAQRQQQCVIGNVDIPCFFTSDMSKAPTADAIWFHGPSFG